jgi:predicted DsbA family dithiol-disulfide isomerase
MMNHEQTKGRPSDALSKHATLQVDVIADLICPWSYLGKRRLDDALAAVRGPSVVTWYPFQINPTMPAAGQPFDEYLASKFGDPEKLRPAMADLTAAGLAEGVDFRFDKLKVVPNTLDAHRLMKLGETEHADISVLAENIFRGFFQDGFDIADRDVLIEIGAKSGLNPRDINKTLDDDQSRRIVISQEAQVRQSGVTGVPDFLVNKRLFVVGAQSTANLVGVFDRVMFGAESDLAVSNTIH